MHSIQEEDEEQDQYSRLMRTGSSIEDDEDPEADFNARQGTGYESSDARPDIEELAVAGTKTQLRYQEEDKNEIEQNKILNEDIQDLEENNYENKLCENTEEELPSETIPVQSKINETQFSVHGLNTQCLDQPHIEHEEEIVESPSIENPPAQATTFSIHQMEENPEYFEKDQTTFSIKKGEEIKDETQINPGKNLIMYL